MSFDPYYMRTEYGVRNPAPYVDIRGFGAVGDGVTDDTIAIKLAFDYADINGHDIFIPPSPAPYITDSVNYRMQSIIGTHPEQCIIKGKPGKDVLHLDNTFGQFTKTSGVWRGFQIKVDDSIDAAANFPTRNGVGNACFASDYNDASVNPYPPMAVNWVFEDLMFQSTGLHIPESGLQKKQCGIYTQHAFFPQCSIKDVVIGYLEYGFWDEWANINPTSNYRSNDHTDVYHIHFIRNKNNWRMMGWGDCTINDTIMHGANNGGIAWHFKDHASLAGPVTGNNYIDINGFELELQTPAQSLVTDPGTYNCSFSHGAVNVTGPTPVLTIDGSHLKFEKFAIGYTVNPTPNLLVINGNRNVFHLSMGKIGTDSYAWDSIKDMGSGNQVIWDRVLGALDNKDHARQSLLSDGRIMHQRDTVSLRLGHVNPTFVSGSDLLLAAHNLKHGTGTEGTTFFYEYDSTADLRVALHIGTPHLGSVLFHDNDANGIEGMRVGRLIPPSRIRVYVRVRTTNAGTMSWFLRTEPDLVTRGSVITPAVGPAWTVLSFEADLTGIAIDTKLGIVSGVVNSAAPQESFIDWIMLRPWALDWPVVDQMISADNLDAAKTLVVGTDPQKQQWNTPLTANRAVTLSTTNAYPGAHFHIIRRAGATGAFTLDVGTGPLKSLAVSQWADVDYDGVAWRLTRFGSL